MLSFPRIGEPFVVEVDASDYAIGGVLSQMGGDEMLHPVAYLSIAFKPSQQNWCPHSKEALCSIAGNTKLACLSSRSTIRPEYRPHPPSSPSPKERSQRIICKLAH